jgi:hypothetical protein
VPFESASREQKTNIRKRPSLARPRELLGQLSSIHPIPAAVRTSPPLFCPPDKIRTILGFTTEGRGSKLPPTRTQKFTVQKTAQTAEEIADVRASAGTSKRTMKTNQAESNLTLSGVTEAILEVGRQRKALLDQMRGALQCGDTEQVLRLARQLCGLTYEESSRVN